ncbi:Timeless protein [Gracilaria domingensis]|nr:Timeless protein [Gracilaria domingensis]
MDDIRTTVQHLSLPDVNPLSAIDATAVDALKDLYYMLNVEDPLNALPARQYVFSSRTVQTLLHPIILALHSHPSSSENQKRWSVPTYQALRTLCVLSTPVPDANTFLPRGGALDVYRSQLCSFLGYNAQVLDAVVALLQYYLERKAAKIEALSSAESCRLEDARIDNILTFFRNILSPPRTKQGDPLLTTDAGTHLALVSALYKADFYATLSVLFAASSPEEMKLHTTDTVFLSADIYAFTFRHSSPRTMFHTLRCHPYLRQPNSTLQDVADSESKTESRIPPVRTISKTRASKLRTALLKERAAIGGSRAVTAGARWTNRHSGGFSYHKASDPEARPATVAVPMKTSAKRVISSKAFVQAKISFNPRRPFQEAVLVNSQVLCLWAAKKRSVSLSSTAGRAVEQVRKDLQDSGLHAMVKIASEFIDTGFSGFVREIRGRIAEMKERTKRENPETLTRAQRSFLSVIGCVVGFQRERYGKVRKGKFEEERSLNADIHQNHMKAVLSADFKILKKEWKTVDAAIEVETFQLAFRVLVEAFEALRSTGKDEANISSIEVATFAVLEMMKMLQGMSAHVEMKEEETLEQTTEANTLTPRELALNTLEDLFREEVFLNAPANLAKDFNSKLFSFRHLTNIVELGYAFTSILMDEEELHRLQVNKKKRTRKKKAVPDETGPVAEKDDEEEQLQREKDSEKETASPVADAGNATPSPGQKTKKKKRIIDNSDDEEEPTGTDAVNSAQMGREKEKEEESAVGHEQGENPQNETHPDTVAGDREEHSTATIGAETSKWDGDIQCCDREEGLVTEADSRPSCTVENVEKPDGTSQGHEPTVVEEHKSDIHQMLEEDADEETENGPHSKRTKTPDNKLSKIQDMLRADAQAEAKAKSKEKTEKAKRMLMADVENEGKTLQAKFVTTLNEAISEGTSLGGGGELEAGSSNPAEGNAEEGSGESDEEPELREMESMGIIRRFAHIRAIHTFMLPIRAMMCSSVALSGESYPIPDGAKVLLSPVVVAKSAHLLASIWKVAKLRERGSLCGQFFTLGNMHFMEIMLNAPQHGNVKQFSVLGSLGTLAREVTRTFFEWLSINPGLTLDMVFGMDKGSCQMYTSYIRQKTTREARKNDDNDSGNDSDISQLGIAPPPGRNYINGSATRSRRERGSASRRKSAARRRQMLERPKFESDEDVDDLDNLKIGVMDSDDDDPNNDDRAPETKAQKSNGRHGSDSLVEPSEEHGGDELRNIRPKRRSSRKQRKKAAGFRRRQEVERRHLVEDEDVDDLDNLKFGVTDSEDGCAARSLPVEDKSSDDNLQPGRKRRKGATTVSAKQKKRRKAEMDGSRNKLRIGSDISVDCPSSDDEALIVRLQKLREEGKGSRRKPKKVVNLEDDLEDADEYSRRCFSPGITSEEETRALKVRRKKVQKGKEKHVQLSRKDDEKTERMQFSSSDEYSGVDNTFDFSD